VTADAAVYLYAIGDAELATVGDLPEVRGVGGSVVRAVADGGLAAVVESVDTAEFGEQALRASLEDLAWLERVARAHDAVVAALAAARPVAPVRLATVYTDDANVRALLREHATAFAAAIDRIRGRAEWGVKAYAAAHAEAHVQTPAATGPGAAYLMRRRAERDRAATVRAESADAAEELHRRLADVAVAARRYPPQDPRLTGRPDEMVLNCAYLVDEARTDAFRQAVESAGGPLELHLTGPWAPYSFATLEEP
jgi:Gas vesicle synthesis protein GvpL/GvpF